MNHSAAQHVRAVKRLRRNKKAALKSTRLLSDSRAAFDQRHSTLVIS
jgi:hypothetical protein